MTPIPDLITSGFQLGVVLLFAFWGLTIPVRWLARNLGL
jgi:hypothetical protein